MVVLRSRVVLPAVSSKPSKPLATENAIVEPETPSKNNELLNESSSMNTTPSSSSPAPELGLESRDITVPKTGTEPRGSARIVGKLDKGENLEDIEVPSGEMKVEGQFGNLEKQALDFVNRDLADEVEKGEGVSLSGLVESVSGGRRRKRKLSMEPNERGKKFMVGDHLLEEIENGAESDLVSSEDDFVEEDKKSVLEKEERVSREKKGKGIVENETLTMNSKEVVIEIGVMTRGKLKFGANASSSSVVNINSEVEHENSESGANNLAAKEELPVEAPPQPQPQPQLMPQPQPQPQLMPQPQPQPQREHANHLAAFRNNNRNRQRDRHRNFARQNAARFAIFAPEQELGEDGAAAPDSGVEDWPGPFSTAMKIMKDRGANKTRARYGASKIMPKWVPKQQVDSSRCNNHARSLQELCLKILCENADAISSLEFVPDALRHKISWFLCDGRGMGSQFLELLVRGSPTEVRLRDCSWLTEELVTKIFEGVDASKLTVLQFDLGGGCMPDYVLHATLTRSPNCLPALTTLSLKGAYRLTDVGLQTIASAAPSLKSIDISQCPLLTSKGICSLLNSLRLILRELYLDDSHGIDAELILPALLNLERLEVLSLAGIQSVSDDFVTKFVSVNGCRMRELVLADCMELTDLSLEVIGGTCSELRAVDLSNLHKLTDVSMAHLANGCPAIQKLKVCRSAFSDEAVAAFLDLRGESLQDLSLNNITQVSNYTALSLSRNCRNLRRLDLSWCRNLSNEALGMIVDSCSLLEVLKLFGCTQVTNVFLDGHSNPLVKILGYKMTSILKYIEEPDFLQGPLQSLERSYVQQGCCCSW